jgi:hypothetical protein
MRATELMRQYRELSCAEQEAVTALGPTEARALIRDLLRRRTRKHRPTIPKLRRELHRRTFEGRRRPPASRRPAASRPRERRESRHVARATSSADSGDSDLADEPAEGRRLLHLVDEEVVRRALRKARAEYVRSCRAAGQDPGPPDECWAEFEALADALDRGWSR